MFWRQERLLAGTDGLNVFKLASRLGKAGRVVYGPQFSVPFFLFLFLSACISESLSPFRVSLTHTHTHTLGLCCGPPVEYSSDQTFCCRKLPPFIQIIVYGFCLEGQHTFGSVNKLPNCYYMLQKMTYVHVCVCVFLFLCEGFLGSPCLDINACVYGCVVELGVLAANLLSHNQKTNTAGEETADQRRWNNQVQHAQFTCIYQLSYRNRYYIHQNMQKPIFTFLQIDFLLLSIILFSFFYAYVSISDRAAPNSLKGTCILFYYLSEGCKDCLLF